MERLHIENLTKKFGKKVVLDNLSFTLTQPGIWALIAPNGTGKTTLFDCITNLQTFQSGTIRVLGHKHTDPSMFKEMAYLQSPNILYPDLSGMDHLQFIQRIQKLPKARIQEVIEQIEIQDYVKFPVKTYSLGMKQHLLLALAILNKPKLLLMDEPLNGLDPTSYVQTRKLLKQFAKEGTSIILSSHQLQEIDLITSQLLFLKRGKLLEMNATLDQTTFIFQLTNAAAVCQYLQQQGWKATLEEASLKVVLPSSQVDIFLRTLFSLPTTIHSMDQEKHYSEHFYEEIFMK